MESSPQSQTPRTVDDALQRPWALLDFIGRASEELRQARIDEIEDAGAAEDRVRQDYSGRYPIELLQNAHDACIDAGKAGAVSFIATESALLVANEGKPFDAARVHALTRLGASSKPPRSGRRTTIGYKGVGFTAVFEITDRPQVVSRGARSEPDPGSHRVLGC